MQGLRIKRHEYLKTSLAKTLRDAKAEVRFEVLAKDPVNRRADIVATGKCCGASVAIDITVTAIKKVPDRDIEECSKGFRRSRADIDLIIEKRVDKKNKENENLNYGGKFLPFVMTTGGTMNQQAADFLRTLRKHKQKEWLQGILSMSCTLAKMRARMWTRCQHNS